MSDDSSQEENGFALVRAAAKGDASKMAELLSMGVNVNESIDDGFYTIVECSSTLMVSLP